MNYKTTLIDLNPDKYTQHSCYYPFMVRLNRYDGSYNTLDDLSSKICFLNKTENVNLYVFNMVTGKNESKTRTKNIS